MPSRRCAVLRHRPAAVRAQQAHAAFLSPGAAVRHGILDPPRYFRSPFGVVDLVKGPPLFKPAPLATAEGGTLICCNNVAQMDREAWVDQLEAAP